MVLHFQIGEPCEGSAFQISYLFVASEAQQGLIFDKSLNIDTDCDIPDVILILNSRAPTREAITFNFKVFNVTLRVIEPATSHPFQWQTLYH